MTILPTGMRSWLVKWYHCLLSDSPRTFVDFDMHSLLVALQSVLYRKKGFSMGQQEQLKTTNVWEQRLIKQIINYGVLLQWPCSSS